MACALPASLAAGKRKRGWQPVSPQVSPSNELWTSCFGRAGLKSLQKPAQQRPGSRWPWAAGLARSHLHYSRNSATLYCTICTHLTNLFTREKYGKGQNWLLIWGKKILLSYVNGPPVCVSPAWYIFQGHLKQHKMSPFFCNDSLIISIFDPLPIILHPHPHFPKAPSLAMDIFF